MSSQITHDPWVSRDGTWEFRGSWPAVMLRELVEHKLSLELARPLNRVFQELYHGPCSI
jgi:hypothetical protein